MGVSQKVKQQRSICEFLFCLKNEAQTRTEKELRAQLGERAVPKSALFSFIERPQGVPLFRVPKDSIWDGPRGGRSVIFDSRTCACRVSVSPGEGFRVTPPLQEGANIQSPISSKKKLALGHGGVPLSLDRMHLHLCVSWGRFVGRSMMMITDLVPPSASLPSSPKSVIVKKSS